MLCRCVIAEMFSDGRQVFDLSHLLEYRRQQLRPLLKWIKDEGIRVSSHVTCLSCDLTIVCECDTSKMCDLVCVAECFLPSILIGGVFRRG